MHPEIEKFWHEAGYAIFPLELTGFIYYAIYKPDSSRIIVTSENTVAVFNKEKNYTKYFLHMDSAVFSEEEMLRAIKLKAFL